MNGNPLPPKKDVALALLEHGSMSVHLDPRAPGVVVPPWFKRQPQLVLQVGLNMPVPIPDLRVDDDGMSCTLSFNRSPFFCIVPWSSAYALVGDDGRGMVWPDDVPPEVPLQSRPRESDPKRPLAERALAVVKQPPELRKGSRSASRVHAPDVPAARARKPRRKTEAEATPSARGRSAPVESQGALLPLASVSSKAVRGAPAAKPAESPARSRPEDTRPVVGTPQSKPGKPKREIPPYLRVVK